jgi:NADH:ubiquinone oxidoreductase subunit 2 (subunit N)
MNLLKTALPYINPAGIFAILILGMVILLFFGISKRQWIKNFSFVLAFILFAGALFINILGYRINGDFSNILFTSGLIEILEIAVVLFFSLVCLSVIFINNRKNEHFVKIVMIFLVLVMCILTLIISKNFISFFISLSGFLIAFFAISTILNSRSISAGAEAANENKIIFFQAKTSKSVARFFIAALFFIVLLFFGFSILYGVSDVKNFLQLYQDIESSGINIILSLMIISISFYIYLGIFPFQAPYISFSNKADSSSIYLTWLFYFPAGVIALLKFIPIISILNKNLKAGSYILYVLIATVLLNSIGSGIACLKTKSLKKAAAYFFSLIITGYFINMIMLLAGFIKEDRLDWLNIFYLLLITVCFLPIAFIFSYVENISKKDAISSLRSLIYKDKLTGIVLLVSLLSVTGIPGFFGFAVKRYSFNVIVNLFNDGIKGLLGWQGWLILIILIIYIAAFAAICLRFIIIIFMKQNNDNEPDVNLKSQKAFYALICFFAALIIFLGIIGLLETLNPDTSFFGIRMTNSAIFIKNLK